MYVTAQTLLICKLCIKHDPKIRSGQVHTSELVPDKSVHPNRYVSTPLMPFLELLSLFSTNLMSPLFKRVIILHVFSQMKWCDGKMAEIGLKKGIFSVLFQSHDSFSKAITKQSGQCTK